MTYGWAILVVLVVIGALAYFGVLNPSILMPEKCTLQTGFACKDYRIDAGTGQIILAIENGIGKDIILQKVNISGTVLPAGYCNRTDLNTSIGRVSPGQEITITTGCAGITRTSSKPKLNIQIQYYNADSSSLYSHTINGELMAKIEG